MTATPTSIPSNSTPPVLPPRRSLRRRVLRYLLIVLAVIAVGVPVYAWWTRRYPQPPTEIFHGVTYSCVRLKSSAKEAGLMHWARIDLNEPGVELYATPLDADAVANGWEYKLKYAGTVASENRLAVVINGTLFQLASRLPTPGGYAKSAETVVAAHEVNHVDPHSFLLWFDDEHETHLEKSRPPSPEVLKQARWAIGGNLLSLSNGVISPFASDDKLDERTMIGIDPARRILWLLVIERATQRRAAEQLKHLGATDGIAVDGGSSSEMAIGPGAAGVRPGSMINTWIPTATHFGVRAKPLEAKNAP